MKGSNVKAREMKKTHVLIGAATLFLLLLPMDFVWSLPFLMLKAAMNGVSAVVYAGILHAMWKRTLEPGEHFGLLFVLGLVTLPYLLLLPAFYYSGLVCTGVSVSLTVILLADWLRSCKTKG